VWDSLADFADACLFLNGNTVAINALLERKGAKTALVTTKSFRDVYEIGRINAWRPTTCSFASIDGAPLARPLRSANRSPLRLQPALPSCGSTTSVHL
jgi:N-methylhydantoinase A/oxoprolinase/acetone carboxylase beta subunit